MLTLALGWASQGSTVAVSLSGMRETRWPYVGGEAICYIPPQVLRNFGSEFFPMMLVRCFI